MPDQNKSDFVFLGPMQISPWEGCAPAGKRNMQLYYEDLSCRFKIAVILGLMFVGATLWTKAAAVRMENRISETRVIFAPCGAEAFPINRNRFSASAPFFDLSSGSCITAGNHACTEIVIFH